MRARMQRKGEKQTRFSEGGGGAGGLGHEGLCARQIAPKYCWQIQFDFWAQDLSDGRLQRVGGPSLKWRSALPTASVRPNSNRFVPPEMPSLPPLRPPVTIRCPPPPPPDGDACSVMCVTWW